MPAINREKLIPYVFGYFWTDRTIETIYPNEIHYFTSLTNLQKGRDMKQSSSTSPDITGQGVFYSPYLKPTTVLHIQPSEKRDLLEARLGYLFVPNYYHNRHNECFMKNLKNQGKVFSNRNDHVNKRVSSLYLRIYSCKNICFI